MSERQGIIITREGLAQFASICFGVSLLVGALGIAWQGSITPVIAFFFAFAIVNVLCWAWLDFASFRAFFLGSQARYGTVSVFSTLLLVGIVALAYIVVQRQGIVVDMTIDSRFTLDPRSLDVIQAAKRTTRPIRITGFYTPEQLVRREVDDQYWQLYEVASEGHITREYINPNTKPAIAIPYEDYLRVGVNVFLSFVREDGTIDIASTVPVNNTDNQERNMTEAIARLLVAGTYKVYFERSLDTLNPIDNTQQGMSFLNNVLRANGLVTDPLSLADLARAGDDIPRDASAVVIARPRRQPTEAEIAVLDRYLKRGGSLFIAGDFFPTSDAFMAENSLFNAYMWENYGLRLLDAIVVDTASSGQSALDVVSAAVFGENKIGANLNKPNQPDTATLFRLARPVEVSTTPPVSNGSVILSSPFSWAERDTVRVVERNEYRAEEGVDLPGPLTLMAWANDQTTGAKVILVGDGEFLTNGLSQNPQGNNIVFLDGVGWLTGFSADIEFTPQAFATSPLIFVGGELLDVIGFITVVAMPSLLLVMGVLVYLRRLRQ
jgi:ABC-2 type transport system permease protein